MSAAMIPGRTRARWTFLLLLLGTAPLLLACKTAPWKLAASGLGLPEPRFQVTVERDVMVPMRDTVRLAADLYHPVGPGPYPAILIRTPYNKRNPVYGYEIFGGLFATQGYAVLIQDVRGKYRSEGDFYPIVHEGPDGIDTIGWMADQPWSDGRIGMFGVSYYGSTEWLAAPDAPDSLKTVVPVFTAQDGYRIWLRDGVFNFNLTLTWHLQNDVRERRGLSLLDWKRAVWSLPLDTADDKAGDPNPIYDEWIANPLPGEFWKPMSVDGRVREMRCSGLLIAGWFDPFLDAMLEDYQRMRQQGGSEAARGSQLIIGPWTHTTESRFRYADFGRQARFLGQIDTVLRWYDYWLRGQRNGIDAEGPIRIFVMGRNSWRTEQEWPLARTRYTRLYLHSGGEANSAQGDGRLSAAAPGAEPPDGFLYDPADPVPSRDQPILIDEISYEPAAQREIEARRDVLVYTSEALGEDLEITGPVVLVLHAGSAAPDTDFAAKLTDVHPDGRSLQVTSGIVRARYRDSLVRPTFLRPGEVCRYKIDLGSTSTLFKKGHRIRLQVSSSDFPRHDRNLNTGGPTGYTGEISPAYQTVFHDADRPSHLILPVIPAR